MAPISIYFEGIWMNARSKLRLCVRANIIICSFVLFIYCKDNPAELSEQTDVPSYSAMHEKYFYSSYVKDTIKLDISLPFGYFTDTTKKYNIIYLTDGYWRKSEHDTIHEMGRNGEIKEAILVGIGYPDYYDFNTIRTRDLIEDADKLLSCIKEEIIPYVEKTYRADSAERTLWGSSYGGYFLMYAFTEHEKRGRLFKNYIEASAALNPPYAHADLLKNEHALWNSTTALPVNLYMTVGGDETSFFVGSYNSLVSQIKSHPYHDFHFEYEVIPNTNHYTVWKPTLLNGLRKFLKPK